MKLCFVVALCLAIDSSWGRILLPKTSGRIVGGEAASITDAPWQVALHYDIIGIGIFSFYCGGSIYSPSVIITAAHCIEGRRETRWRIRSGSSFHNSGGQTMMSKSLIVHEDYNSRTIDYDIGLIILTGDLVLDGTNSASIPLPVQNEPIYDDDMAFVTGWGSTVSGGNAVTGLRKVSIPVVNQEICKQAYASLNQVTDRMVCAGYIETGGKDACQGDSGGPFVIDNKLVGITSWGYGCAAPGYPGVSTRVAFFIDWIETNLNKHV